MPPNIAFATTPATLSDGTLRVSGESDPLFVSAGPDTEEHEGRLVARSVIVQQGTEVCAGPASLGGAKSWTALIEQARGLEAKLASATAIEVYAFEGRQSPLTVTLTWSQDIEIEPFE